MKKLLCPSMMCADFGSLSGEVESLEQAGADIFHVDIMDGRFVPNYGMGLQDLAFICKHSRIPVDVHLMVVDPGQYVEMFARLGVSIIYIHPDAEFHPMRTLQKILDSGCKAGIAVDPGIAVETVLPLLPLVDYLLIMSVNPGFAGQKFIPSVNEKIHRLACLKEQYHYQLMMDGACSPEQIRLSGQAGVDGFVLGTSALFGKEQPYHEIFSTLRSL